MRLKFILLVLLICLLPNTAFADNAEVEASVTVINNKITDLAVGNPNYTTLTLTWTSPQSNPPNWGPATQYDIRYSLSPITTEPEWQAATQLANPPLPSPPGSPETLLVIGLNTCTAYYFAIKAADATGTWIPLSNSPQGTTLCYSGGGGDIGVLPASYAACPITLAVDMQGNITTARMCNDGILCDACLAKDTSGKNTLELDKDTKVMLAGNIVPRLLTFRESSATPPTTENTVLVSPVYEFNAYSSPYETTPSPVTISPPARLILSYNPDKLPQNTTEVFIANYDTKEGWLPLAPVPGAGAEIGKAHGLLNHSSLFAVLANLGEPESTKLKVSNLTINPSQAHLNQEITISVNVANTGGKNGDYSLELRIDGSVKSTTQVSIAASTSQTVNFTTTGDAFGKHRVEVAGLVSEFEVIEGAQPFKINWWLIGSVTGVILVLAIWAIVGWRWLRGRKKAVAAPTNTSAE
jgi:hypothetical protein